MLNSSYITIFISNSKQGSGRAADLVADLQIFFSEVKTDKYETKQRFATQLAMNKNNYSLARSEEAELNSM